ncbi:hypothetical protein AVEN_49213-1, partial [Araneus ventricosus]
APSDVCDIHHPTTATTPPIAHSGSKRSRTEGQKIESLKSEPIPKPFKRNTCNIQFITFYNFPDGRRDKILFLQRKLDEDLLLHKVSSRMTDHTD